MNEEHWMIDDEACLRPVALAVHLPQRISTLTLFYKMPGHD
jgi:hypothetical protein